MDAHTTVRQLFIDTLGLPSDVDAKSLVYRQTAGWDSLGHMQLIGAIEGHFDIMLETQDVLDMSDFAMAMRILAKYGVDAAA